MGSIGRIAAKYDGIFQTCSNLRHTAADIENFAGPSGEIVRLTSDTSLDAWIGQDQQRFEAKIMEYSNQLLQFVQSMEATISSVEAAARALQEQEAAAAAAFN